MTLIRKCLLVAAMAGLAGPAMAQPSPSIGQPAKGPTPIERFMALPADRQEALRNELQPLFFKSLEANGRLIRMAQDCNLPVPTEATPVERLETDLQSPQSMTGKLFGSGRQGALLARLRGALQTSINCQQAPDLRPGMIQILRDFPNAVEIVMKRGLAAGG